MVFTPFSSWRGQRIMKLMSQLRHPLEVSVVGTFGPWAGTQGGVLSPGALAG